MPKPRNSLIGAIIAAILFLLALYVPGLSGLICIVMTLPIVVPLIFAGYVLTHLFRRYDEIKASDKLPVLLLPLILFVVAGPMERYYGPDPEVVREVRTHRILPYRPELVYDAIKSVDTLDAEKPFLMTLDLPVPVKCILEDEGVGGIRQEHEYVFNNLAKDLKRKYANLSKN